MSSSDGAAFDASRAIARAVLYEGYVLWPYGRTAAKNQRRWTIGGVHPRAWSEAGHEDDAWKLCAECLVETGPRASDSDPPEVRVTARFLQVVERKVARVTHEGFEFVDEIEVDGDRRVAWDEAREREVEAPPIELRDGAEVRAPIAIHAAAEREWLEGSDGRRAAALVRGWRGLAGELRVRCARVAEGVFRIRAEVSNTTDWEGAEREDALRSSFASAHVAFRAAGARFVSLTDPPDALADAADACRNEGCWPVLVGAPGARDEMLASPIILPDHPAIAPESPGDLFDGGEIDELLTLHILALTDREKEEMRATDPRTREILDRTNALGPGELLGMHGTFRDGPGDEPSGPGDGGRDEASDGRGAVWDDLERAPRQEVVLDGVRLARGSRVRLHPRRRGDVMDLVLADRIAIVEGVDEDAGGEVQLAVVIEGDPGADLGMERLPGHRFYFRLDEVEPLGDAAPAEDAESPGNAAPARAAPGAGSAPSILVAGIGNIFLGDDGFGVEVVRRLADRGVPPGVKVEDFGIRGLDLGYSLGDYETVVFVDAVPRGEAPGTVYLIEAAPDEEGPVSVDTHGMHPVKALGLARALGSLPGRVYVLGCEPERVPDPEAEALVGELSPAVDAAVDVALDRLDSLLATLTDPAQHDASDGALETEPQPTGDSNTEAEP